jgi:hypothetical protein
MDRAGQRQEHKYKRKLFSGIFTNVSVVVILLVITSNLWGAFRVNQLKISGTGNQGIIIGTGQNSLNTTLAAIGQEIIQPHNVSKGITDLREHYTKSLPAVPAAMFLVLTGFFCVSAVRDRRAWLAALASILWFSQSGLPNVIKTLSTMVKEKMNTSHMSVSMESSEYLGLLYYQRVGVPENRNILKILSGYRSRKTVLNTDNDRPVQQWAINFSRPYTDLAVRSENFVEKYVILLPAISPVTFPRGPPEHETRHFMRIS